MNERITGLETALTGLLTQYLPPTLSRLKEVEGRLAQIEHRLHAVEVRLDRVDKPKTAQNRRIYVPMNRGTWEAVHARLGKMSVAQIARELDAPYTTVRNYIKLPREEADALPVLELEVDDAGTE